MGIQSRLYTHTLPKILKISKCDYIPIHPPKCMLFFSNWVSSLLQCLVFHCKLLFCFFWLYLVFSSVILALNTRRNNISMGILICFMHKTLIKKRLYTHTLLYIFENSRHATIYPYDYIPIHHCRINYFKLLARLRHATT